MSKQDLCEKAFRIAVRKLISEAGKKALAPVSLERGSKLFNDMKTLALKGADVNALGKAVREAIRQLKIGDRADQKFADNLRAYQGSIKSGHSKWVIAELAFAEWQNRRKANPVVEDPVSHVPDPNDAHEVSDHKGRGFTEGKKTRMEQLYEAIADFAAQNGREAFSVLDDMMAVAEKEVLPVQVSGQLDGACDDLEGELPANVVCMTSTNLDDSSFKHNDVRINNPLYDPAGKKQVDPQDFYGDAFMNSKFPFVHGDHFIVDPRYNEVGDTQVDPLQYYGESIKKSAYLKLFSEQIVKGKK